ncbi:MAG: ankyrin repeat domain-containing protein [Alphaproteobacteria bacterium]
MLRKIFAKVSGKTEQQIMNDHLRKAAIKGNLARVQKLVKEGAEVDCKDVNDLTPLYFASGRGFLDITRFLLEQGANPNVGAETGIGPPLVQAGHNGDSAMIMLLLEFNADINAINYSRRTALHLASAQNHLEAATLLLDHGSDPNTVDRMGYTPLHDAVGFDYRALALKLAECGADGSLEFKYGDDIRKKAEQRGSADIVQALDDYKLKAAREAAAEKAVLDQNIAAAPVLQNDIAIKKPLIIKPKTP